MLDDGDSKCAPIMNSPSNVTVDLSSYSKGDYRSGPRLRCALWYLTSLAFIESALPWPIFLKRFVLRCFGAQLGEKVVLKPRLRIKLPWNLTVGDHSWLGEEVWIDNLAQVDIGSNVCLSQGACIMTGNHDRNSSSFELFLSPVRLGNGVWVGARSIVCPGTEADIGSVIEAGAVVKGALEKNGIYSGNPAVLIGTRKLS